LCRAAGHEWPEIPDVEAVDPSGRLAPLRGPGPPRYAFCSGVSKSLLLKRSRTVALDRTGGFGARGDSLKGSTHEQVVVIANERVDSFGGDPSAGRLLWR
jgi:hypothetical protein